MKFPSFHAAAVADFHPVPSVEEITATRISVAKSVPENAGGIGIPVGTDGDVPKDLGLDRATLAAAGFEGRMGQSLIIPRAGAPALIAVGIGARAGRSLTTLRHAAAVFARAGSRYSHLVAILPDIGTVESDVAAQALVEGVILARYRYRPLKRTTEQEPPIEELTIVAPAARLEKLRRGIERGRATARATELARNLANVRNAAHGPAHGRSRQDVADGRGSTSRSWTRNLAKLGCGGMLGVNAGSSEPPRLIKLRVPPEGQAHRPPVARRQGHHVRLRGISLKPNDLIHAA